MGVPQWPAIPRAVKRRKFLAGAGALGLGAFGLRTTADDPLAVRVWFSERAADHPELWDRVRGYLERALREAVGPVRLSSGGSVAVPTEDAYLLLMSAQWPQLMAEEVLDGGGPVTGVNLLVTDGDMATAPTGAGVPHLAAVGGAETLASLPPADDAPAVVDYADRWRVLQVLLHEVGHALGLDHDDGAIRRTEDGPVVSPMVSSYAWAPDPIRRLQFDYEASACGEPYPAVTPGIADLSLRYSACARRRLSR